MLVTVSSIHVRGILDYLFPEHLLAVVENIAVVVGTVGKVIRHAQEV